MRTYVLTDHERTIVDEYLETGKKLNGFRVLRIRMEKHLDDLENELRLIKMALNKLKEEEF